MIKFIQNKLTLIFIIFIIISVKIYPQGSVEFFQSSDIENYSVFQTNSPNIVVNGDFNFFFQNFRGSMLGGNNGFKIVNKFNLSFQSVLFSNTTLFINFKNKDQYVGSEYDDYNYYNLDEQNQTGINQSDSLDIEANLYYLEYRHNPLAKLILGRQNLKIGDRQGIIYEGNNIGITQSCMMGTWCYYIGYTTIGDKNGRIGFAHLNYPIFDQDQYITTLWEEQLSTNRFDVEIFNISYDNYHVPLALYGGSTIDPYYGETAIHSKYQVSNIDGNYINRNANWQYWGFNLDWQRAPYKITSSFIRLTGNSDYFEEIQDDVHQSISGKNHSAYAFSLEGETHIAERFRIRLKYFTSSGNEQDSTATTATSAYELTNNDNSFYEINKGTYKNANLYFSSASSLGQSHSIGNLTFYNFNFAFMLDSKKFGLDIDLYNFSRTEEVFNTNGDLVKQIGTESDINFKYNLTNNLDIFASISLFQTDEAYSSNDNITPPVEVVDNFSAIGFSAKYSF